MAEEKEEFSFIREKIKEKPVNKKRILKHGIYTVGFAVLFGAVACLVFTFLHPILENLLYPKESPTITIPEDELGTEWQTEETERPLETEETEASEETPEPTVVKELEISDYQMLQNKIYAIGKEANRSVVTVTGVVSDTDWYNNSYENSGLSSGVIIGDNGSELLILTEHKVVKDAGQIHVTFVDDVTVNAYLKKYDGNTGIAILSIALGELSEDTRNRILYATLGNSNTVTQGNIAIAIGSPLGTNYSIGTGNITSVGNVIQTIDATYTVFTTDIVGSSNSSGVLLNLNGEIVGLVRQDYSGNGDENTLTAISISEVKKLIEMLSNGKDIPYLGLRVAPVTDKIAMDYELPKGIYVKEVLLDSPAFEAGLQSGDVIVEMGGEKLDAMDAFEEKVLTSEPGSAMQITVNRQGMNEYLRVECRVIIGILR